MDVKNESDLPERLCINLLDFVQKSKDIFGNTSI